MSTTNEIAKNVIVIGDGLVTTIPFEFNFIEDDVNVKVNVIKLDTVTLVKTTLVNGVDYIISGTGIILSVPLSVGENLLIERDTDVLQVLDYDEDVPFPAEVTEDSQDRIYFILAELKDLLTRAALLDEFADAALRVILPNPENGMYLAWDGTTGALKNASTTLDPLLLSAIDMTFDNSTSTLTSSNVQAAIDELDLKIETLDTDIQAQFDALPAPFGDMKVIWQTIPIDAYGIPPLIMEQSREVFEFEVTSKNDVALVASIEVPSNYFSGPLSLRVKFYSKESSVNAQFRAEVNLFRGSYNSALDSTTYMGAIQALTANQMYTNLIPITNASGEVDTTAIQVGDIIQVALLNNGASNTTTSNVYLLNHVTGVLNV